MQRLRRFLVVGLVLLAACVPSLHPFFTDEDLVFEPALLGTWARDGGEWSFSEAPGTSYGLRETGEEKARDFHVHLFRLKDRLFLDFYLPMENPDGDGESDFAWMHRVPVHTVARVWIEDDLLLLGQLSPDWLVEMIEKKKVRIAHERIDGNIVLTAGTKDLQKLICKYADDPRAFKKPEGCEVTGGVRKVCLDVYSK